MGDGGADDWGIGPEDEVFAGSGDAGVEEFAGDDGVGLIGEDEESAEEFGALAFVDSEGEGGIVFGESGGEDCPDAAIFGGEEGAEFVIGGGVWEDDPDVAVGEIEWAIVALDEDGASVVVGGGGVDEVGFGEDAFDGGVEASDAEGAESEGGEDAEIIEEGEGGLGCGGGEIGGEAGEDEIVEGGGESGGGDVGVPGDFGVEIFLEEGASEIGLALVDELGEVMDGAMGAEAEIFAEATDVGGGEGGVGGGGTDIAEDITSFDGGELILIAEEDEAGGVGDGVEKFGEEGEIDHRGFVDDDEIGVDGIGGVVAEGGGVGDGSEEAVDGGSLGGEGFDEFLGIGERCEGSGDGFLHASGGFASGGDEGDAWGGVGEGELGMEEGEDDDDGASFSGAWAAGDDGEPIFDGGGGGVALGLGFGVGGGEEGVEILGEEGGVEGWRRGGEAGVDGVGDEIFVLPVALEVEAVGGIEDEGGEAAWGTDDGGGSEGGGEGGIAFLEEGDAGVAIGEGGAEFGGEAMEFGVGGAVELDAEISEMEIEVGGG